MRGRGSAAACAAQLNMRRFSGVHRRSGRAVCIERTVSLWPASHAGGARLGVSPEIQKPRRSKTDRRGVLFGWVQVPSGRGLVSWDHVVFTSSTQAKYVPVSRLAGMPSASVAAATPFQSARS